MEKLSTQYDITRNSDDDPWVENAAGKSMKPTIGEDLSQADKRDKIRSQLYYELGLPETPRKQRDNSVYVRTLYFVQ
jgi:hypothetical protein